MLEGSTNVEDDKSRLFLDITNDVCPLTFVKTRLFIERMSRGAVAVVRLKGTEPIENVPRSVRELGHEVIALEAEEPGSPIHRLTLRKA
jgi:TusA-related sulfurtransferase